MKKAVLAVLLIIIVSLAACAPSAPEEEPQAEPQAQNPVQPGQQTDIPAPAPTQIPYKIGIITGTASQSEQEFWAAENMKAKYGDMIVTAAYPDNYQQETEALISGALELAESGAEAIVLVPAVAGTSAAIDRVREAYPDMLFICGVSSEEPEVIASKADVVINSDEVGMGAAITEQAKKMGAATLVHYTFPRHMSYETLSLRRDMLREACEANGIQFVDATAPDPQGNLGIDGVQQFILDDVPRMVEKYGKNTAFFSTDCAAQEPLIKMVLQEGALYPQQCCPSPFHAYPGALGIELPVDKRGDVAFVLERIEEKITAKGGNGRFSTWPVPAGMLFIEAGVEYAVAYLEGDITSRNDGEALTGFCGDIIGDAGTASLSAHEMAAGDTLKNYYLFLSDYINF